MHAFKIHARQGLVPLETLAQRLESRIADLRATCKRTSSNLGKRSALTVQFCMAVDASMRTEENVNERVIVLQTLSQRFVALAAHSVDICTHAV
eukprot:6208267-Pleurochrysis_carterae.AAC.5